ncbi:MAG: hypothetical protein GY936_20510 [Ignavibacteriae bacterium]|nr:hypothetical protein [Ignavibacteriota bacterium]
MKHIKRRFFFQKKTEEINLDKSQFEFVDLRSDGISQKELSERKGTIAFLETVDNIVIGGFVHNVKGKNYVFPVPDPTLVYFNNAQLSLTQISKQKKVLLEKLDHTVSLSEPAIHDIYNYHGLVSGFVIFLFTAIESFINQMIPDSFSYTDEQKNRTLIYNKIQIQEHLDFKTKISKALVQATEKNFFQKTTPANQYIWNLKEFRDEIIHTKQDDNIVKYQNIIKKSLNFNYEKAINSVATFMNFYKKDYIIECDCGKDF